MSELVPIKLDYSYLLPEVTPEEISAMQPQVTMAHDMLHKGTGQGNDFLGWLEPREIIPAAELAAIKETVTRLRTQTDTMVVIGIGGSYLGARTVIEALQQPGGPRVLYAGQTLSAHYTAAMLDALKGKKFSINVVSKSGTTTEPALAFRLFRELLESNVGKDEAKKLIVATTDQHGGALRYLSNMEQYQSFVIPGNVGGRYSVLTAVGLVPIAFAGIDIDQLLQGAINCAGACANPHLEKNPAYVYAVVRNLLYKKGKAIEMLACFEPRLHYLAEWWKQLYGESEGKDLMGLFPASAEFTTDLHSLGQWIQQGQRNLFETFIDVAGGMPEVKIPLDEEDADGLNYIAGLSVAEVNRRAYEGTALAHRDGGVPNMTLTLRELNAYSLGALIYFFEKACGVSGYLLGVNPFDQPGVEAYKKNMFALLNKPEYRDKAGAVIAAIQQRQGKHIVNF